MLSPLRPIQLLSILLFLPLFMGCNLDSSNDSDLLTIQLINGTGQTPFAHGMSVAEPVDTTRESVWTNLIQPVAGIPDTLLDPKLYTQNIQIRQLVYESFVTGKMDTSFYEGWTASTYFDPADYTSEYVDQQVHFILAHDADSNRVLIFDADNDEDFEGESAYILVDPGPNVGWLEAIADIPSIEVQFDLYDGEQIATQTADLIVNPFMSMPNGRRVVLFGSLAYKTGELIHNGQKYAWWVANTNSAGIFTPLETRVWFEPLPTEDASIPERPAKQEELFAQMFADTTASGQSTSNNKSIPEGFYPALDEPYEVGDFVQLGEEGFTIADIDISGKHLVLEQAEQSTIGLRTGMTAPGFEGPGLDSTTVSLADYRGKYVLIDFWGTWCAPCLGEIPHLKEVYETYSREEFDILAVANDDVDALRAFVEEEGLPWKQVVQSEGDESLREVLDLYRITGYPTTFLIDPDGVIVARENQLRGKRLAATLARFIM